jgi:hypothetical protein
MAWQSEDKALICAIFLSRSGLSLFSSLVSSLRSPALFFGFLLVTREESAGTHLWNLPIN